MSGFGEVATYYSWDELEAKQKQESRKLEGEIRAMLKKAKKSEKKEIEAKVVQLEYDLKAKHRDEEILLEEYLENNGGGGETGDKDTEECEDNIDAIAEKKHLAEQEAATKLKEEEDRQAQARIAKAAKKKNKKAAKEAELQRVKEEIAENAGPAMRDLELDALNALLLPEKLCIKEIQPDGNCLYRSIADQLLLDDPDMDFVKLRKVAADYMRAHEQDFAPFTDCEEEGADYATYCNRVENSTGEVEWGGQLELRAISSALRREIQIYDSMAPLLVMDNDGDVDSGKSPIKLTFHRHFYTLGEHYNSVRAVPEHGDSGEGAGAGGGGGFVKQS